MYNYLLTCTCNNVNKEMKLYFILPWNYPHFIMSHSLSSFKYIIAGQELNYSTEHEI